jgi:hypothetical protein
VSATKDAPLTYAQQLLLQLERGRPGRVLSGRFIVREAYRVAGEVRPEVLRRALADVIARHGALRTVIVRRDRQRVLDPMPSRLVVHDLAATDTVDGFVARLDGLDYPWNTPPLLHAHLGRYAEGGAVLVLVAPHVAADAWSLRVLARDLAHAYTARLAGTAALDDRVMQYRDIAEHDHSPKWQETISRALPYWRERLSDAADLGLPVRRGERPGPTAVARFEVGEPVWQGLRTVARRARTTPFTLLLTAYVGALFADAGAALVPVLTAGRIRTEWDTVGFLLNALWLRVEVPADGDPATLHRGIDRACREAYAHDIPLLRVLGVAPAVAAAMAAPGGTGRVWPAFQFIPRLDLPDTVADPALRLIPVDERQQPARPVPLPLLWTVRQEDAVYGYVSYDSLLFDADWVAGRIGAYLALLTDLATGLSPVAGPGDDRNTPARR